jgi:hypothetical protein
MTELEAWHARNDAYLSAGLTWLRLRLELLARQQLPQPTAPAAPPDRGPNEPKAEPDETETSGWHFFRRSPAKATKDKKPVPRAPAATDDTAAKTPLEDASEALARASKGDPPPALLLLSRQLGLSEFERNILLLCLGMELDTRVSALCARAQDDPGRTYPTFALAMALFDDPAWEALSPERPLRYWRLLEINQPGAQPLTTSALRADERIVSYAKGLNYIDDRLSPLLGPMHQVAVETLPASQQATAKSVVSTLTTARDPIGPVVLLGRDRESKRLVAGTVAAILGIHCYRLPADLLPAQVGELETLARLWQRDSLLLPLALYVDAHDVDKGTGTDGVLGRLTRFVLRTGGLVVVDSRDGAASSFDHALTVEVDKPTPAEQRAVWQAALGEEALGEDSGDIPARLAGQFNLNQDGIASIVALARQSESSASLEDRLWQQCLAKTRPGMDRLAEKLDAKATWDDIVLPEQEASLLRQIAAQVQVRSRVYDDWGFRARMNRGLGISALFAGDSGTGKTMAAEVLANALQLDLYRIDLSAVVSKYIGETEKNLRQVFDAAEDGGAILFFDEADAIFGKRSEVKDSHDRYANIEINYLLQRMEAYRGLAILASNMKSALDSAFMRRLRFIVNFPFPSAADRKRIWERVFPTETKTDGLDHDRLARFTLTGGSIHNIALNSAFLAAQGGDKVTMPLIFEAARTEFRKLDRTVNEADFRLVKAAGQTA